MFGWFKWLLAPSADVAGSRYRLRSDVAARRLRRAFGGAAILRRAWPARLRCGCSPLRRVAFAHALDLVARPGEMHHAVGRLGVSTWMIADVGGISRLFVVLLLAGGLAGGICSCSSSDGRPGYYPLMAVMLLSIAGALRAATSLNSSSAGKLDHASSYFMIAQGRDADPRRASLLPFLVSAYCCLRLRALWGCQRHCLARRLHRRRRCGERLCPPGARLPDQGRRDGFHVRECPAHMPKPTTTCRPCRLSVISKVAILACSS